MDCNIIFQQKYHKLVWLSVFEWVLQWLKLVESIILLLDYFYNTVKSSGIVFVIVQFTENWKRLSDLQNNSYVELLHNFKKILSKHLSVNISRSAEILMEILHLIMETKTTPSSVFGSYGDVLILKKDLLVYWIKFQVVQFTISDTSWYMLYVNIYT